MDNSNVAKVDSLYQKLLSLNSNKGIAISKEDGGCIKFTFTAEITTAADKTLLFAAKLFLALGMGALFTIVFMALAVYLLGFAAILFVMFMTASYIRNRGDSNKRDLIVSQNSGLVISTLDNQNEYISYPFALLTSSLWSEEVQIDKFTKDHNIMLSVNGANQAIPYPVPKEIIDNLVYFANLAIEELSKP